jgi:Domain of unknown function (DUF4258)
MDIGHLQYSRHAHRRMRKRRITEDEIEAIVWYPIRRVVTESAVEHYGYADDGRKMKVVTDRTETYVISIIDEERRPHNRRREKRLEKWRKHE